MREELKRVIHEAFDAGELSAREAEFRHAVREIPELDRLLTRLLRIDRLLAEPEQLFMPEGFPAHVVSRLPTAARGGVDLRRIRTLGLLFFLTLGIAVSLFSGRLSGVEAGFKSIGSFFSATEELSLQVTFLVTSAVGILFVTWLFVSSFFGIRSRRVVR
jgi:hypothetical protein